MRLTVPWQLSVENVNIGNSQEVQGGELVSEPIGIAVCPKIGKLFWANYNFGNFSSMYSAFMDGSNPIKIKDTETGFITGIAIDFENSRHYWADQILSTLETCNLEGGDDYVIASLGAFSPSAINIMGMNFIGTRLRAKEFEV